MNESLSAPLQPASLDGGRMRAAGRLRLRTLVNLRWLAVAGQTAALLIVAFGLGFSVDLLTCLLVISASAWVNVFLLSSSQAQRLVPEGEAALQIGYDILQLSGLLALTGGPNNPFFLLLIAPIAISASTLRLRLMMALIGLCALCVTAFTLWHNPLPWIPGQTFELPQIYRVGLIAALAVGIAFTATYASRVAVEQNRLAEALAEAEAVLAREQRLSALGGLAAAAAHELGTPLATIHLVASELAREAEKGSPLAEDAALLVSQSERCRTILGQLSSRQPEPHQLVDAPTLRILIEEIAAPHEGLGADIAIDASAAPDSPQSPEPLVWRRGEIRFGLGNIIENAIGYATARVEIQARWTDSTVDVIVRDDGPGFGPEALARLGEPYFSERDAGGGAAGGLGLGVFIAKTLLERSGAKVEFRNRRSPARGASVLVSWPRAALERPPG
jgi:two-component system, sensor histidine kinase RegB